MKTHTEPIHHLRTSTRNASRVGENGTHLSRQLKSSKRTVDIDLSTIIVPVDFSTGSLEALDFAVSLARRLDASILLLHALDPIYSRGRFDSPRLRPLRTQALKDAKRRLAMLAKRRVRLHVPVRHQVIKGVAYSVIVEAAAKTKADMIVMGSEGRTGMNRFLVGSVAEKVIRHARCPVLVARGRTR